MEQAQKKHLHTAMMLLEIAAEDYKPEMLAPVGDYILAAHSYIQLAEKGSHSWDGAEPLVRAVMVAAGSDMVEEIAKG